MFQMLCFEKYFLLRVFDTKLLRINEKIEMHKVEWVIDDIAKGVEKSELAIIIIGFCVIEINLDYLISHVCILELLFLGEYR